MMAARTGHAIAQWLSPQFGEAIRVVVDTDRIDALAADRAALWDRVIDSRENLVRIPLLKHIDISAWYSRGNKEFGDLSPRDYLRDKDWDEQMRVGLDRLRDRKVLK